MWPYENNSIIKRDRYIEILLNFVEINCDMKITIPVMINVMDIGRINPDGLTSFMLLTYNEIIKNKDMANGWIGNSDKNFIDVLWN